MKVLALCGDAWHRPEIARTGLGTLAGEDFTFDWIEVIQNWTPNVLTSYPLVILAKSGNCSDVEKTHWMTDSIQSAFSDYVMRGNGLLAIHSGTVEYEQKPVIRNLLGGVFLHHPEQCLVNICPRRRHPLCSGIGQFTVIDEHYFVALDDPRADVFLTTKSMNGDQPAGWRPEPGKGRVVILTPGHNLDVWLHPSYQALLRNSLAWCAKVI